jgi:hypothetical protein
MRRATLEILAIVCAALLALVSSCAADPDEDGGGDSDTDTDTDTDTDSDTDSDSDTDDSCEGVVCDDPPDDICGSPATLVEYVDEGECVSGDCWYDSVDVDCETECIEAPGDDYCEGGNDTDSDTDSGTDTDSST